MPGSLPSELGLLSLSIEFRANNNSLTGTIFSELTRFTELKLFYLEHNSFTGTIPPFADNVNPKYMRLDSNMLTGTIPNSIAQISGERLQTINFSNNSLTGTIPKAIFNASLFKNLQKIYLYNNSFTDNATCPPHLVDCYLSCFQEGNETCRTLP